MENCDIEGNLVECSQVQNLVIIIWLSVLNWLKPYMLIEYSLPGILFEVVLTHWAGKAHPAPFYFTGQE